MLPVLDAMFAGKPAPLGERGELSAIGKTSLAPPWTISLNGLVGDEQADPVHHGGPDKALHHYARDHYPAWALEVPAMGARLAQAPAFGENISTLGLTENDVCIGDVVRLGVVCLQIAQGRQPCWKLNARFGVPDLARRVQTTGRTGWYYRVLEPGRIEPGTAFVLEDRPQPDWLLSRVIALLYTRTEAYDDLAALSRLPQLAEGWRQLAARRVANRRTEDWSARLGG